MTCERALELILDSLMRPLTEGESEELQQHLDSCPSCAADAEQYRKLWKDLDEVAYPELGSDGLARLKKSIDRVRKEEGITDSGEGTAAAPRIKGRWSPLMQIAAALVLVAGGVALSKIFDRRDLSPDVAETTQTQRAGINYLFLMRGGEVPPEARDQFSSAMGSWLRQLGEEGQMVGGETLSESTVFIPSDPEADIDADYPILTGFMIVRAVNLEHARRIAATSPTLEYGGSVEVSAIEE